MWWIRVCVWQCVRFFITRVCLKPWLPFSQRIECLSVIFIKPCLFTYSPVITVTRHLSNHLWPSQMRRSFLDDLITFTCVNKIMNNNNIRLLWNNLNFERSYLVCWMVSLRIFALKLRCDRNVSQVTSFVRDENVFLDMKKLTQFQGGSWSAFKD